MRVRAVEAAHGTTGCGRKGCHEKCDLWPFSRVKKANEVVFFHIVDTLMTLVSRYDVQISRSGDFCADRQTTALPLAHARGVTTCITVTCLGVFLKSTNSYQGYNTVTENLLESCCQWHILNKNVKVLWQL